MEHDSDGDTDHSCNHWNNPKEHGWEIEETEYQKKNLDRLHYITENSLNTKLSPGELKRFAAIQISVKTTSFC